jgi:DNA-binding YbaB/EbfC family protein
MVKATLNGKGVVKSIKIDPSLIVPADAEVLEDLLVAALNDAKNKVDDYSQAEMGKLTGGLPLPPGLKLPF